MGKRVMVAVIGAGIGSLLGLLFSLLAGESRLPLIVGAVAGAIIPLVLLGKPGR